MPASLSSLMTNQSNQTAAMSMKGLSVLQPLFFLIILLNLMGLMPYTFAQSSHLMMTAPLAFSLWASLILSSMLMNPRQFLAHFLPSGAPLWLNPSLLLIEMMSTLLRPITLAFRLAANMTTGHIIMSLMALALSANLTSLCTPMILIPQIFYSMFEAAICLIQAYIFCLLLTLYAEDHSSL
uniref:ATP synthase subunit a n=1 Tax=Diurodrilus subterraneus TaxID=1318637 RepID=M9WE05_9ANNE|nr:ATP synthase F0 subunit 6 [Diurodrilus subterraneus]